MPILTIAIPNHDFNSDAGLTDASYIRLQNLSFSYALPQRVVQKMGMKGCSIGLTTSNLFVITRYDGPDPDIQTVGLLPPAKTLNLSISFNF